MLLTRAGRFVVVSILATLALCSAPVAETGAVTRDNIAVVVDGAQLVALTSLALGESIVRLCTLLAECTGKVSFAGANSIDCFAIVAIGAIQIALTLTTPWIAIVPAITVKD